MSDTKKEQIPETTEAIEELTEAKLDGVTGGSDGSESDESDNEIFMPETEIRVIRVTCDKGLTNPDGSVMLCRNCEYHSTGETREYVCKY